MVGRCDGPVTILYNQPIPVVMTPSIHAIGDLFRRRDSNRYPWMVCIRTGLINCLGDLWNGLPHPGTPNHNAEGHIEH